MVKKLKKSLRWKFSHLGTFKSSLSKNRSFGVYLGLQNTWTSHIAYKSVISLLLGQSLWTSKYSPVHGAWQRFSVILSSFQLATVKLCTSYSQTADRKVWSLKSEMKFHFCWEVKKFFLTGLNELYLEWTLPPHATHCLASCLSSADAYWSA